MTVRAAPPAADLVVEGNVSDERLPATGADLLLLLAIALGMTVVGTLILRRGRQPA